MPAYRDRYYKLEQLSQTDVKRTRLSHYKHLSDNNILYWKQFGFQEKHSTELAIMQLVDQINCSLKNFFYILDIFIDLSKALGTV